MQGAPVSLPQVKLSRPYGGDRGDTLLHARPGFPAVFLGWHVLERDRATRHRARRGGAGARWLTFGRTASPARRGMGRGHLDREVLERIQEAERRRIAQELHDTTGQNLSAAVLDLEQVVPLLGHAGPGAGPKVAEALALCLRSLDEIRTLSYELNPPLLDAAGLAATLRWYVPVFARRAGIRVELRTGPGLRRLPGLVELALFRIAQEALLNVKRHSGSPTAVVSLARAPGGVRLEIQDRGGGMPSLLGFRPGAGLRGMRDRVESCGGRLEITSGRRGTCVRAIVPGGEADDAPDPARGRP
jgi:signal transduction histidine kinase